MPSFLLQSLYVACNLSTCPLDADRESPPDWLRNNLDQVGYCARSGRCGASWKMPSLERSDAHFDAERLRRRWCRFADLKILNASSCIEQLHNPMRSSASSGPCLVRLSRIAKLLQNRWVSTARGFFYEVRRSICTQLAQPILKLTLLGLQSRRENRCHALMQRPQIIERHFR